MVRFLESEVLHACEAKLVVEVQEEEGEASLRRVTLLFIARSCIYKMKGILLDSSIINHVSRRKKYCVDHDTVEVYAKDT